MTLQFSDIPNITLGHAQDHTGLTGCTVLLTPQCAPAGVYIGGGGPASRETPLCGPFAAAPGIHALLLSGGSAFSLGAADGVMRYLRERGVGVDCGGIKVPLVCQSALFDLGIGNPEAIPTAEMAYHACLAAETPLPNEQLQGSIGAGTGCTVGKLRGMEYAVKGGIGIAAREYGGLQVGAVVAVNAIGDVCGPDGTPMAGLLADDKKALLNSVYYLLEQGIPQGAPNSTTLCAVATNARLDKTQCARVAALAYHGITRAVRPAGLSMDGDTVYALSCGDFTANADIVGTLAAEAVFEAIQNSIVNCTLSIVN